MSKNETTRVNVMLPLGTYQRLQRLGIEHRVSASGVIRSLLAHGLDHLGDPELQAAIEDAADQERARRRGATS
jgi:hypothetical protein